MSVFAELPDGRRLEFPDGTDPAVIQRTVKKVLGVQEQQPSVADEYGPLQAGVVSAGRTLDRLYKGAKDLALTVPAKLGHTGAQEERKRMEQEEAQNTAAFQQLEDKHPVSTFIGQAAPLVAAPVLGGGALGMAASAALPGLIEYGTPEERLKRGALGAAGGLAGAAVGKVASRVVKPNTLPVTETRKAAMDAAERLGVDLRASEKTGSRVLGWSEAALNDLPFSGGMAQKAEAARQAAVNRGAAKSLGQAADEITPDVLAAARKDTSAAYNALIGNRQILLDKPFRQEVRAITGSKVIKALRDESVEDIIGPFQNLPQGNIRVTGEWFQQNKTALDSAISSAYTKGEVGKAKALEKFENALERAAARSMTPQEREAFKTAQRQWSSLRMLETGAIVEGGNVMPGRLNAAMRQRYKQAFREGKITGELADIAKLGDVFKPLPQSGTTPRAFYSGIAGGAAFADPMTSAAIMGAPALAQKALQSKTGQRYLTKGLLDISPETERLLMLLGAGGTSGGLLGAQ